MVAIVTEEPASFMVGSIGDADMDELHPKAVGDVPDGRTPCPEAG